MSSDPLERKRSLDDYIEEEEDQQILAIVIVLVNSDTKKQI